MFADLAFDPLGHGLSVAFIEIHGNLTSDIELHKVINYPARLTPF